MPKFKYTGEAGMLGRFGFKLPGELIEVTDEEADYLARHPDTNLKPLAEVPESSAGVAPATQAAPPPPANEPAQTVFSPETAQALNETPAVRDALAEDAPPKS